MLDTSLVDVDDPIYHSSFTKKYIDYRVSYNDGKRIWKVRRRFSDFVKLHETLVKHEPMLHLPLLPTYHIYTLWDRCNPKLIKERRVRLRLYLEYFLNVMPEHPILENFLKQDPFNLISASNLAIREPVENISQDDAYELNRRIQNRLKIIEAFSHRLLHLQRSIKIYGVFWDANLSCRQGLVDSMKQFAHARSASAKASFFNEVSSKFGRERILMGRENASAYCASDQYLIDHYLGLIQSLLRLNSSCEEARKRWLRSKDHEIDSITEARLLMFDETKDFETAHSKLVHNERAKEITEEKLRDSAKFLQAIHQSIDHFEKQYQQDISVLISSSTDNIKASLTKSIQIWHENGHEINLTDDLHWR